MIEVSLTLCGKMEFEARVRGLFPRIRGLKKPLKTSKNL